MFAIPHSSFPTLMAILSPKQLWHFLMEQEHNTDPLTTSWVNPAALIHWGMLCSPHHHRDAALRIFTKTHRDGTCVLPVGKSWAQPQPILSPFPMSLTVHNSAAKEGKRRHQSPVTKHILHSRHWKTWTISIKIFSVLSVLQALEYESFRPPLKESSGKKKQLNPRLFYSSVMRPQKDNICLSAVILKSVYLQP